MGCTYPARLAGNGRRAPWPGLSGRAGGIRSVARRRKRKTGKCVAQAVLAPSYEAGFASNWWEHEDEVWSIVVPGRNRPPAHQLRDDLHRALTLALTSPNFTLSLR